jgi:hypothetical protein
MNCGKLFRLGLSHFKQNPNAPTAVHGISIQVAWLKGSTHPKCDDPHQGYFGGFYPWKTRYGKSAPHGSEAHFDGKHSMYQGKRDMERIKAWGVARSGLVSKFGTIRTYWILGGYTDSMAVNLLCRTILFLRHDLDMLGEVA